LRRSPDVPAVVVSVDAATVLAGVVPALVRCPNVTLVTARPVWIWKARGRIARTPIALDADGWRRLTVYTADDHAFTWRPLHSRLAAALRAGGAAGATVLRARLAYVLDDPLRPDRRFFSHREAPIVTTIVDTRARTFEWFGIIDELTGDAGFVTCAPVNWSQEDRSLV